MKSRIVIVFALSILIINLAIPTTGILWGVFKDVVLFVIIPILALLFIKARPKEFGLSLNFKESIRYSAALLALALPVMLYASTLTEFRAYYPMWQLRSKVDLLFFEGMILSILMFSTEFFFRGFLLFSLEKEVGRCAIVFHAIPYALAHLGKPWLEVPYSFFVGLIFGYVALKTKSIMPTFLTHWWGAAIFDVICEYGQV